MEKMKKPKIKNLIFNLSDIPVEYALMETVLCKAAARPYLQDNVFFRVRSYIYEELKDGNR